MNGANDNFGRHGPPGGPVSGPTEVGPYDEERGRGDTANEGRVREDGPYDEDRRRGNAANGKRVRGDGQLPRRKGLRNANINYRAGWWAVTVQVAQNKSLLGAIVGDKVVLNALGREVEAYWQGLPAKYPELELFDYVVMPNHFHALLRIHWRPTNQENHLGFLMGRFKGGTSFKAGRLAGRLKSAPAMKAGGAGGTAPTMKTWCAGNIVGVGFSQPAAPAPLWQRAYWDDLVSSDEEFAAWQKYIRENPKNWSRDRYGACTTYMFGDPELLNAPRIAFVASQGFFASDLRPRKIWAKGNGPGNGPAEAGLYDEEIRPLSKGPTSVGPQPAPQPQPVLISTFTSAQEREALRRALAKGKRLIAVFPQGLTEVSPYNEDKAGETAALFAAAREGRALLLSPQPPGSRLNKKVATWCNEYVLRHADEIWVGDISPNGMLSAMLQGLGRLGVRPVKGDKP